MNRVLLSIACLLLGVALGSTVESQAKPVPCEQQANLAATPEPQTPSDAPDRGALDRGLIQRIVDERFAEHIAEATKQLDDPETPHKLGAGEKVGGPFVDALLAFVWKVVKTYLVGVVWEFIKPYLWATGGGVVGLLVVNVLMARAAGKSGARAELKAAK